MEGIKESKKVSEGLRYERNYSLFNFIRLLHWGKYIIKL
jgi:hypothetical protein